MGIFEPLIDYYNNDPFTAGAMLISLAVAVLIIGAACAYLIIGIKKDAAEQGETLWVSMRRAFKGMPIGSGLIIFLLCSLGRFMDQNPYGTIMLISFVLLFEISKSRKEQK